MEIIRHDNEFRLIVESVENTDVLDVPELWYRYGVWVIAFLLAGANAISVTP